MLRSGGQSQTLVNGGRKKVHTTFDDGSELVRNASLHPRSTRPVEPLSVTRGSYTARIHMSNDPHLSRLRRQRSAG
jgi:hypothetical protein